MLRATRIGSAGISAPDDAPFPWDDYDGDAIDQPVRARVRHLLAHHGIKVVAVFDEAESDLEARAAEFIRYLEV